MTTITEPGLVYDLSEATYHSDPVEGGSLSSTGAKRLLESPATYKWFTENPQPPKEAFDVGSAVHSYVLGTGAQPVDHGHLSLRTNAAKEDAAAIRANGDIPVTKTVLAEIRAIADAVLNHPVAGPAFTREDAWSEVSAFAKTEDGLWLRSRMDKFVPSANLIVDLKTSVSADVDDFQRTAVTLGYDVSAYHYKRVMRLLTGQEWDFIHVIVSKNPPHLVSIAQLDAEFMELAESRWQRAYDRYKRGRETGEWPGIPPIIHKLSPPSWALYKEEDTSEREEA